MCNDCNPNLYSHAKRDFLNPRCGCFGVRRFLTREEKIKRLEEYKEQLLKEIPGVEEMIKDLKQETS